MTKQDHTQTIDVEEVKQSLYAKREKIHPRKASGLFSNLQATSILVLLGLFYILPWIQWGDRQAVLLDLPARQFHIFWITFWPQDFVYLAALLILAGLSLFFFTALAGRLWCGFACPQTVWTAVFIWMERLVEGDRAQRIKLDKAPSSLHKFSLRASKQVLWIVFSLFTGYTFIGYFVPIHDVVPQIMAGEFGAWPTFWLLFYAAATYGLAGVMREQVCTYMCPYARFQSAMFDKDTMIIAYDYSRGEPRGSRKRGAEAKPEGLGDCIDCTMCVQVCPTGIDIRDGLQYQCISCSACIDACDEIMDKMGYARGLVRYTTENVLHGQGKHVFRPRIFVYAALLLVLFASLIYAISQRVVVQLDVIRDRNTLYKETPTGMIENVYTLKAMNMDTQTHTFTITVEGIEGMQLMNQQTEITMGAGEVRNVPVSVVAPPEKLQRRSTQIDFVITSKDNPALFNVEDARFLGPIPKY